MFNMSMKALLNEIAGRVSLGLACLLSGALALLAMWGLLVLILGAWGTFLEWVML